MIKITQAEKLKYIEVYTATGSKAKAIVALGYSAKGAESAANRFEKNNPDVKAAVEKIKKHSPESIAVAETVSKATAKLAQTTYEALLPNLPQGGEILGPEAILQACSELLRVAPKPQTPSEFAQVTGSVVSIGKIYSDMHAAMLKRMSPTYKKDLENVPTELLLELAKYVDSRYIGDGIVDTGDLSEDSLDEILDIIDRDKEKNHAAKKIT